MNPSLRLRLLPATLVLAASTAACGGTAPALPGSPAPDRIPTLERRLEAAPGDPAVLWRLGAAYRNADDPERAQTLLEQAALLAPDAPEPRLFLGMTYEDLGRPGDALASYVAYRDAGGPGADALEGRIAMLRRLQLREAARTALARETSLAGTPPRQNAVAVFPFMFAARDEALRPLSLALAEMLATDLSQTGRIEVVERARVGALLDEMALGASGLVDPATAARSGRLVGAGQIVQGRVDGSMQRLLLDATLVEVMDAGRTTDPISVEDAAEQLFDMEKAMAFQIFEAMGVQLTAAERERVNQRRTENLQAVLAFGMGLESGDRGDFEQAAAHFAQAAALDPSFTVARERAREAEAISEAAATDTDDLAGTVDTELADLSALVPEGLIDRDPTAEILGTERIGAGGSTSGAVLEVIIRPEEDR